MMTSKPGSVDGGERFDTRYEQETLAKGTR
jgi:hypothetical protein